MYADDSLNLFQFDKKYYYDHAHTMRGLFSRYILADLNIGTISFSVRAEEMRDKDEFFTIRGD